jgi:lysophospholipase L1-like esterase
MNARRIVGISKRIVLVVALFATLSGCGGSPTAPAPPPGLTVTCPGNVSVQSMDGNPLPVTFDPPRPSGGAAPVTTSCSSPTNTQFPVGSATVTCQAQDARGQTASCAFTVTVQPPPRLVGQRILAFGDSLTEGAVSPSLMLLLVSIPHSYPFQLQDRLVPHYRVQSPVVLNEGIGGEKASDGGIRRFRSVLHQHRPEIVLLMEGTNDLLDLEPGANAAMDALRGMVLEAKSQNVRVGLATIPPQRSGGQRNRDRVAALIPGFNDRVRALAAAEGVALIEVFDAMRTDLSLIGIDDLHPTERGYQFMADVYFEAIKRSFEERPTAALRNVR